MNEKYFLAEFSELLQSEQELKLTDLLSDLEDYDSLAKLAVLTFIDTEFQKTYSINDLETCVSVKDIFDLCLR